MVQIKPVIIIKTRIITLHTVRTLRSEHLDIMAPSATITEQPTSTLPSTKVKSPKKEQIAIQQLKERLPYMGDLKGLLFLSIKDSTTEFFLDTRVQPPQFLEQSHEEPDCRISISPEIISALYHGKLEPRYAMFKDGLLNEAALPTGNMRMICKFGDLMGPVNPTHPKSVDPSILPKPTEDLDKVRSDLREFGYGLVKNALDPDQLALLQKAVREQAAGEVKAGVASRDGGATGPNQRIWTLINKGQEFLDMLEHPLIDEVVEDFLGENFLVHSFSANIARPGNTPQQLHSDQLCVQPPVRSMAFGMNVMWFLTDITRENGGTRIFPASHVGAVAPDDPFNLDGTVAAEGPAGTALVFDSRLWHATGPNEATSGERPVILMFFMRSFIRQQENNFLSIRPEVEANLTDRVKNMLGYRTTGSLGGLEGDVREGLYVSRLKNPVGLLREPVLV